MKKKAPQKYHYFSNIISENTDAFTTLWQ